MNGPETCCQNPMSPSNSGLGPVIPSRASIAAKTPLRAAWAKAQPFHIESSPARVSRKAAEVISKYIITDMYAKAVQGMPAEEAVKWAEGELTKVYT